MKKMEIFVDHYLNFTRESEEHTQRVLGSTYLRAALEPKKLKGLQNLKEVFDHSELKVSVRFENYTLNIPPSYREPL